MSTIEKPKFLPEKVALSMAETCAVVSLCRSTVERMVAVGQFPKPRRVRGRVLFSLAEVRRWFDSLPKAGEARGDE